MTCAETVPSRPETSTSFTRALLKIHRLPPETTLMLTALAPTPCTWSRARLFTVTSLARPPPTMVLPPIQTHVLLFLAKAVWLVVRT